MAGSKRWYLYVTDNADIFAINLDESNTALTETSPALWTSDDTKNTLPRNLKPRQYTYESTTSTRKIVLTFLTKEAWAAAPGSIADPITAGQTLVRGTPRRENQKPTPRSYDTGLTSP